MQFDVIHDIHESYRRLGVGDCVNLKVDIFRVNGNLVILLLCLKERERTTSGRSGWLVRSSTSRTATTLATTSWSSSALSPSASTTSRSLK